MEKTEYILDLIRKEIIKEDESLAYYQNQIIILEINLQNLKNTEKNLLNHLNEDLN
jgi:RNA binding exosome subunit